MADTIPPLYEDLLFPAAPEDRPYVFTNMVMTLDGKTVSGSREEAVMDLGSPADHAAMRQIQAAADAVMIGAGTLRATKGIWFPTHLVRVVVTRSGQVPLGSRFFTDVPEKAIIAGGEARALERQPKSLPHGVMHFPSVDGELDLRGLLRFLRVERGVARLLVEGGSELNGELFGLGVVDELFLTLAPRVKLGRTTPTYAGGEPLPRGHLQNFELISECRVGDELFLRYRRKS
ncbi:MAG: RibD family protein [Armatimonadetes bacterium]|nr:RibD family protein [Armatimonadota bacterium]